MNIPAYFICDAACWATYSLPGHTVGAVGDGEDSYFNETYGGEATDPSEVPAHFVKADTLEELAEKLGIDAAGLAAEIAASNENAAKALTRCTIAARSTWTSTPPALWPVAEPIWRTRCSRRWPQAVLRRRVCARHLRHCRRSYH